MNRYFEEININKHLRHEELRIRIKDLIRSITKSNNKILSPKLAWMNNSRIRLKFEGSCLKQEDTAPFSPNDIANLFTVYELDSWPSHLNTDFALDDYLFGFAKLIKNADPDKYSYSGYGIGFGIGFWVM